MDKIKLLLQESIGSFAEIKKGSDVIDYIVDEKVVASTNDEHTGIQANRSTLTLADKETSLTFGSSLTDKNVY